MSTFKFQSQRVKARKILLNKKDVINFDNVPDHIVDAFFGSCTYRSRLTVSSFGFLNGLTIYQVFQLCRWNDMKQVETSKVEALYKDLEKPQYQHGYYSYNVNRKLVMFLNGDIRKFGKRIPG